VDHAVKIVVVWALAFAAACGSGSEGSGYVLSGTTTGSGSGCSVNVSCVTSSGCYETAATSDTAASCAKSNGTYHAGALCSPSGLTGPCIITSGGACVRFWFKASTTDGASAYTKVGGTWGGS
jgi:hypothetical protein